MMPSGLPIARQPAPKGFDAIDQPHQGRKERQLQLGQVFAALVIAGVRPGPGVDDRMLADFFQLGVIPAPAEIVA